MEQRLTQLQVGASRSMLEAAWALQAGYPVGPASLIGLGRRSIRELPTDDELRL